MSVKILTGIQIRLAYWMRRGGEQSLIKVRSGSGIFLNTKEFVWKTTSRSLRCGCALADRKTWCHNHNILPIPTTPPTWANHSLPSWTTHVYIWSLPGEGADIILHRQNWAQVWGGREAVGSHRTSRTRGGDAQRSGDDGWSKNEKTNLALLKLSFCQLNTEGHPASRQKTLTWHRANTSEGSVQLWSARQREKQK